MINESIGQITGLAVFYLLAYVEYHTFHFYRKGVDMKDGYWLRILENFYVKCSRKKIKNVTVLAYLELLKTHLCTFVFGKSITVFYVNIKSPQNCF